MASGSSLANLFGIFDTSSLTSSTTLQPVCRYQKPQLPAISIINSTLLFLPHPPLDLAMSRVVPMDALHNHYSGQLGMPGSLHSTQVIAYPVVTYPQE